MTASLNTVTLLGLTVTLGLWCAACCCPASEPQHQCWSSARIGSAPSGATGTGVTREAARDSARLGACITYCQNEDPRVDKAYRAWRQDNEDSELGRSDAVSYVPQLKAIQKRCTSDCSTRTAEQEFVEECRAPAPSQTCKATIKYKRKTVSQSANTEILAVLNACGDYCEEYDKKTKKALKRKEGGSKAAWTVPEGQRCRQRCAHKVYGQRKPPKVTCR